MIIIAVLAGVAALFGTRQLAAHVELGIASQAEVTASALDTGASLRTVVSAKSGGGGWVTSDAAAGVWISFEWPRAHMLRRIVLDRGSLRAPGIVSGWLSFADGSRVEITLSTSSPVTVVPISPREVDGFRFTVSSVAPGARRIGLSRVQVFDTPGPGDVAVDAPEDGDVAPAAVVSSSAPGRAKDLRALVDGERTSSRAGQSWAVSHAKGVQVTLQWAQPRELDMIAIAGAPSVAQLKSATVYFSDGSRVAVGAVIPDAGLPTVVSFMARATTSVRIAVDTVSDTRQLRLAEIFAYQVGGSPVSAASLSGTSAVVSTSRCDSSVQRPTDSVGVSVECPMNGSQVGGSVRIKVALGPTYDSVKATILPAVAKLTSPSPVIAAASDEGVALVDLTTAFLPAGPFTVLLEASSRNKPIRAMYFQLYKAGVPQTTVAMGTSPGQGRSLVYSEEFNRPLSITRTGSGADYAASKPQVSSVQDFGAAIFADPASGLGNVQVVGDQYLQISVKPKPAGLADPQGWRRRYVGGLLSSARPGGSGFSGQYAYFEARMLAPQAPGTWPAFWMLPSPSLVAPESAVAEIDAVELYGHSPESSCQTTHQYVGNKQSGIANCARRWTSIETALQWHTYGVSVDPTTIRFYIDNKLVATAPQVRGGADPLFFMVNLALGGGWPIDLAATGGHASLYVDYIHVYE